MCFQFKIEILVVLSILNVHCIHCTRIPLEVYEPTKTSHQTTRNSFNNNLQLLHNTKVDGESRRGRQMFINNHENSPRILYQVGNSEEELPICAPNAVCSKIDLYETPWIERQCRCPKLNTPHIIYHHKTNTNIKKNKHNTLHASSSTSSTKFKQVYDNEKQQQQRRLLDLNDSVEDIVDRNIDEHKHIREIIKKLGAIYETDDIIQPSVNHKDDDYEDDYFNLPNHSHDREIKVISRSQPKRFRHHNGIGHHFDYPKISGCSSHIGLEDGYTIADKTRQYKLCDPVYNLPTCRYFRDYTWTLISSPTSNATEQIVHCMCPKNSITYLVKRESMPPGKIGYTYLFACSPHSRLRCLRKEPCKLFTVRKRQEFLDEVNTNPLCQCPRGHYCPKHHTESGVISGKTYIEDNIRTYAGYCMPNLN